MRQAGASKSGLSPRWVSFSEYVEKSDAKSRAWHRICLAKSSKCTLNRGCGDGKHGSVVRTGFQIGSFSEYVEKSDAKSRAWHRICLAKSSKCTLNRGCGDGKHGSVVRTGFRR